MLVLVVGKGGNAWADEAVADYTRRLRRWGGIEERAVKPERFRGDVDAVRAAEGARILARVKPRDRLIVLDERGEDPSTDELIATVRACRLDGTARLVFAIGGAYGHDPTVRDAAWKVVRLSSFVLNHEVARVVLYEQLYRVSATIAGVPYHH
jgi:23S rRNA (pseudouridine1915-N3)-methyltransferase